MIGAAGHRSGAATESVWSRFVAPPRIDTAVAAFALILGSGAFQDEFLYKWPYGTAILHILWASVYGFVIFWLWRRFHYDWVLWSVRRLWLLVLILGIILSSTLWSLEPAVTFRRSLILIATSMVGIFLGYNFAPRALMRLLFWVLAGLMVASTLVCVAFPEYATAGTHRIGTMVTSWRGIFGNKNSFGAVAAIACVVFFIGMIYGRIDRYLGAALLVVSLAALLMSRAASSYVVAFTGLFVAISLLVSRRLRFPALVTLLYLLFGMACAAWITMLTLDDFTEALGRDATLTKRTIVWHDAQTIVSERPWTGYGYEAVWGKGEATWFPNLGTVKWAAHAHNGFLDLATQIGLPGAILALAFFVAVLTWSIQAYLRHPSPSTLFAVSYVFMTLIANIPSASFFSQRSSAWILFVALSTAGMRMLYPPEPRAGSDSGRTKHRRSDAGRQPPTTAGTGGRRRGARDRARSGSDRISTRSTSPREVENHHQSGVTPRA